MSAAESSGWCFRRARAAASAYGPPEPTARMPSSGEIRSPVPEIKSEVVLSATIRERLELAEHLVGSPIPGELDGAALEIAAELVELRLEPREEREGVGRRAREAGEHVAALQPADLRSRLLHHGRAEGDLAVRGHRHAALVAHADDGRRMPLFLCHRSGVYCLLPSGLRAARALSPASTIASSLPSPPGRSGTETSGTNPRPS